MDFGKVVRDGSIDENSFKQLDDGISYTYSLNKDGYKLSIAVKETNDGKKY